MLHIRNISLVTVNMSLIGYSKGQHSEQLDIGKCLCFTLEIEIYLNVVQSSSSLTVVPLPVVSVKANLLLSFQ